MVRHGLSLGVHHRMKNKLFYTRGSSRGNDQLANPEFIRADVRGDVIDCPNPLEGLLNCLGVEQITHPNIIYP